MKSGLPRPVKKKLTGKTADSLGFSHVNDPTDGEGVQFLGVDQRPLNMSPVPGVRSVGLGCPDGTDEGGGGRDDATLGAPRDISRPMTKGRTRLPSLRRFLSTFAGRRDALLRVLRPCERPLVERVFLNSPRPYFLRSARRNALDFPRFIVVLRVEGEGWRVRQQ